MAAINLDNKAHHEEGIASFTPLAWFILAPFLAIFLAWLAS